jgi:RNA recognition motif-containing protein
MYLLVILHLKLLMMHLFKPFLFLVPCRKYRFLLFSYFFFLILFNSSEAHVMWDPVSGKSRGFGFVAFRDKTDAEQAIATMNGEWLGSRAIRCNWATQKGNLSLFKGQKKKKINSDVYLLIRSNSYSCSSTRSTITL